jgi:hypothetical protein
VGRLDSMHLLIALTAHEGWEVHHMNVKLAFLNDLHEYYMEPPVSFIVVGKEHKVLKLRKSIVWAASSAAS